MREQICDAFGHVRACEELKAETLRFLRDRRERPAPRHSGRRAALAAVCAVLLLCAGLGGVGIYRAPASYVSVDVNPSVELTLNRFDRVLSAVAYNGDGALALDGLRLVGRSCTDAIDALLERADQGGWLTGAGSLTVTVAAEDGAREEAVLRAIQGCAGYQAHGGQGCLVEVSSIAEAHSHGLSFGKYAAYLELAEYDHAVTPEDCHHMTMEEIYQQIRLRRQQCAHGGAQEDGCAEESGGGHHYGHGHDG